MLFNQTITTYTPSNVNLIYQQYIMLTTVTLPETSMFIASILMRQLMPKFDF